MRLHGVRATARRTCAGSFLKAIYRSNGNQVKYIDKGVCCKPNHQPIEEVYTSSDCRLQHGMFTQKRGTYRCPEHFALAGLQRGGDVVPGIDLSTFWCCPLSRKQTTTIEIFDDVEAMDDIQQSQIETQDDDDIPESQLPAQKNTEDAERSPEFNGLVRIDRYFR